MVSCWPTRWSRGQVLVTFGSDQHLFA